MATQPKHYVSVQEYLDQEEAALDRHEYLDGEIFAMAASTPEHSLIACNIIAAIGLQLRNSDSRILGANMRLRTAPGGLYGYADAVICCSPEIVGRTTLLNAIVIVEVLSESTQDYDRGRKFEQYRQIPSFREYLVIAQDRMYVEHHVREGSADRPVWIMRQFSAEEDTISLEAVKVSLPLAAVYAEVSLQPTSESVPLPQ